MNIPSSKLSWYTSDIAFVYTSVPPCPAYIFVNKLFLLASKSIPTRGCIIPCPSTTRFLLSFITGLFKICVIAPISLKAEFTIKFVSESSVIIYFIFSFSLIVFTLNLSIPFNRNSLNSESNPLFLSQPK